MRKVLQNNVIQSCIKRTVRGAAQVSSKALISSNGLTEKKNENDGRIISVLEKPITVEFMDK